MKKEKSCGCIIIKDNKVLLVYEKRREFWGFPKGHVEEGETEVETAKREVKEEVNLDVEIEEDKKYEFGYVVDNRIEKTCVLFLAHPKTYNIKNQDTEIEHSKWYNIEEALKILPFEDQRKALEKVTKN